MTMTSALAQPASFADFGGEWLRRVPRTIWALAALALVAFGGQQLSLAMQSPGEAIRSSLLSAAAEMQEPSWQPSDAMLQAVAKHFAGQDASVRTELWPQVTVTLHNLDRATCVDAAAAARRMEGRVVVQLAQYRSITECGAANTMTWWIMP